jgi:hypothetical protein
MKYYWRPKFEFGWFSGEVFELFGLTFVTLLPDMFVLLGLKFGKFLITIYWDRELLALS